MKSQLRGNTLEGGPAERAQQMLSLFPNEADRLARSVSAARVLVESQRAREWLHATLDLYASHLPEVLEYLEGTALAIDASVELLAASAHRSFLAEGEVAERVAQDVSDDEGCSVAAGRTQKGETWVVKNRDNNAEVLRRHLVARHRDPGWGGRTVIGQSTIGGPMAASGGINSAGFVVVSTAIEAKHPPPGIYRVFLQDALLGRCTRVDQALDLVLSLPHLGGTITMADASGVIAAVELNPDAVVVERPSARPWVARTNHYCGIPGIEADSSKIAATKSCERLAEMRAFTTELSQSEEPWMAVEERIITQMTSHDGAGAVCRHGGESVTIATSLFTTRPAAVLTSIGPGCEGNWERWTFE